MSELYDDMINLRLIDHAQHAIVNAAADVDFKKKKQKNGAESAKTSCSRSR